MRIKVNKNFVETASQKQEKTAYVRDMFASIAPRYDFFNDVISLGMHRHWKKFVVKLAALQKGDCALDICTGTGDIAFAMAKEVGVNGRVCGLDFVEEMLAVARQRQQEKHLQQTVSFIKGDAMQLPFPEEQFDAVTVAYGLRNVKDIPQVIDEMKRVTKPGGRIISLDLGKPQIPVYREIYYFYFYQIMPLLTSAFQGKKDAYNYLPNSLNEFPAQKGLLKIMQDSGLHNVKCYEFAGGAAAVHIGVR